MLRNVLKKGKKSQAQKYNLAQNTLISTFAKLLFYFILLFFHFPNTYFTLIFLFLPFTFTPVFPQ